LFVIQKIVILGSILLIEMFFGKNELIKIGFILFCVILTILFLIGSINKYEVKKMSQFGKEFDRKLDEHITKEPIYYDEMDNYADKQIVDNLIIEFKNLVKTQNNLIDKLKLWEKQITKNFVRLKEQIIIIKENKDKIDFAGECFIKLSKVEKNTKINNANINLLEMKLDNLDNFIQSDLVNKHKGTFTEKDIKKI